MTYDNSLKGFLDLGKAASAASTSSSLVEDVAKGKVFGTSLTSSSQGEDVGAEDTRPARERLAVVSQD